VGLNFQRATRQYIETEILLVNDRMVVDIPGEEVEGGQAWQELVKTLRVLGFDLSKKDGWELLGLPKFDGPDPDKATVLRRAGLVDDLLDKANDTVLEPEEQAKRAEWVCRVAKAKSQCVEELREVRRLRGQMKVAKDRLPRWAEAPRDVVEHIMKEIGWPSVCALGLSNVLKSEKPQAEMHQFCGPAMAREVAGRMCKGGQDTVDALREVEGRGLVLWCPDNREDMGRLCAGVAKAAGLEVRANVTLIIPLLPRPGCHKVGQFLDTWSHELLQGKWAPIIKETRFSSEPMKIVVSGAHAPMHQVRSLCMVTLSTEGGDGLRTMMRSRGVIGTGNDRTLIVVDLKEEEELEFLKRSGQVPRDIVEAWHGPTKAASSTRECGRIVYAGTLREEGAWAARVSVLLVKERMEGMGAVIGMHSTYSNEEAVLIDITSTEAAHKVQELLEDAVLVTPTLMVARSTASEAQWGRKVGEIFADRDNAYVERVRYRPSTGGGILAEAPALKEQKDRKKYEAKGSDGKELQVVIRLGGEFVEARRGEVGDYVRMVKEATGIPLANEATEIVKEMYQWALLQDARHGWRGNVVTRLGTKEEVLHMFTMLEGKVIEVAGGGRMVIEVLPHISLMLEARSARAARAEGGAN